MSLVAYAPASIGNVSVGFDVLGAALAPIDGTLLGDRVLVAEASEYSLQVTGRFAHKLPSSLDDNIVTTCYHGYVAALAKLDKTSKPLRLVLEKNLPIGSGLGSSASSIVAALYALNEFHQRALDNEQLLALMGELEGQISGSIHYDNVAPCYLGGLQLMLESKQQISATLPSFKQWYWVVAYPGISISTSAARAILPAQYRRQDVLTYGRQLGAFVHACYAQNADLAAEMLSDVIAEPYRAQLIPGFEQVRAYAADAGLLASGISGSGPTVFLVTDDADLAQRSAKWLETNFIQNEDGFCHVCKLDDAGTRVTGTAL